MVADLEALHRESSEKDQRVKLFSDQYAQQKKMSEEAELSMQHLNKTLEDLKQSFEGASQHANVVMRDNDQLRVESRAQSSNIEIYQKQIENLKGFIEELETNNKDLMRHIDKNNMLQATDYQSRVSQLLGQ